MTDSVPDEPALREGLRGIASIHIDEGSLAGAVGESGRIHLSVEVQLAKGRVQYSRGAAWFERAMDFRKGGRR